MPYFAAIAAIRIQSWISRTPDLRYVRGASHALTHETRRETLTQANVLPAEAFDTDTAQVAGVTVLRSDHRDALDAHVDRALVHLQHRLPGVEWSAWRARADSYVMAYDTVNGDGEHSEVRHWPKQLPLSLDLPFARACDRCSHELAIEEINTPDGKGKEVIGPDCARRRRAGANSQFATFDELAAAAGETQTLGRREAANHIATVCADGNRVGDFFTAVAALKNPALQAQLSKALDAAAHAAVDAASRCGPNGKVVAMMHFVGGDDIFVSVAAPFAWPFVESLGRTFEKEFQAKVHAAFEDQAESEQIAEVRRAAAEVSLGIGVAFAHKSHPIADSRETAAAAETVAKAATRGRKGAVSWIDITIEPSMGQGSAPVPKGRWVTVERLGHDFRDPHPALVTSSSARAILASLLRPEPKRPESAEDFSVAVRDWATRIGRLEDTPDRQGLARYLPDPGSPIAETMIEDLRHTVDRARWWPVPPDENADASIACDTASEGDDQ